MGKAFLDDLRKLVINDGEQRHYQATLDYLYRNLDALDWLIEQAEKVEQLEQEIERLKSLVMYAEEKGLLKKKICSYCNSIYWARHGNSRYCPNCDRRTVWSRKKSKRTLEEIE